MKPLEGIRLVELARILAGPWAGQLLADMGADVIKVEAPAGDDTRRWGPPFIQHDDETVAAYFHACNRGKSSVTADFSNEAELARVKDLISQADVVIENFKVGGLKRFGLDYETVAKANPGLVYCSITGFGQTGPYASRAGYDFIIQGMSGLMSITGEPDGQPQKVGVAVTDIFTGLYAVNGILAALIAKGRSGKGQQIDMALLDVATAITANQAMNFLATGQAPKRMGNAHPNIVPYQVFDCSDGHIIISVGNDGQFQRFVSCLGRDDLAQVAEFQSNAGRLQHRETLIASLSDETRKWRKTLLLQACEDNGVPAGPINSIDEVFADPQVISRGMQVDAGGVPGVKCPIQFSASDTQTERPSPKLGEHQDRLSSGFGQDFAE